MLEVRRPGLLTTVQDGRGRPDAASLGVPRAGAADPEGLAIANLLLRNGPAEAGLELTLDGPELVVVEPTWIALGGADLGATVDGVAFEPGTARPVVAGQTIAFAGATPGAGVRAYLALPGGIDVPTVLGSAATSLVGRFGGLDGRPLRTGDRIAARRVDRDGGERRWPVDPPTPGGPTAPGSPRTLRALAGPHGTTDQLGALASIDWSVSPASDRTGIRLTGGSIAGGRGGPTSLPMTWGAVQLPPGGEPIVLGVDAPTVGGYPVIAVVASVDRPEIGQLGPGDRVRFVLVDAPTARTLGLERRRALAEAAARIVRTEGWDELDREAGAWPRGDSGP